VWLQLLVVGWVAVVAVVQVVEMQVGVVFGVEGNR
jgi:hypothetical protein